MKPVSPVIPGNEFEVVYAENQPEYIPLPTIRTEHLVLSRWQLTEEERAHIAQGGDLFILQIGRTVQQPVMPIADAPDKALQIMMETDMEWGK